LRTASRRPNPRSFNFLPVCGWFRISNTPSPTLNVHFNINKPLVVDALLKTDIPMTIARLWRCDGKYHLTAFEGRTIPMRRKLTGNTALVEVNGKNVYDWFDTLAHAGLPHHVVLFAGHHQETFRRLARIMRIDWVQ
jgi:hypothetical protein